MAESIYKIILACSIERLGRNKLASNKNHPNRQSSEAPINWWRTDMGEAEKNEMNAAFEGRRFTTSSSAQEVETIAANILGIKHVLCTNSGSSALLMSLLAIGVGPGDEVIVPSLTWIATANAAAILGAKVILCDTLGESPVIDHDQIESLITPKTKAIVPVHLNGRVCNLSVIQEISAKYGIHIIEDSCKALLSKFQQKYLGTRGDIGCYSLGMISPISIGFGGLVATNNSSLYQKLLLIRDHGVNRNPESYDHLGFNFKVSDILVSMAKPQFLDYERRIQSLIQIHNYYEANIKNNKLKIMPIDKKSGSVPVYVEAFSLEREEIINYLDNKNISTSRYHKSIDEAAYLRNAIGQFPNSLKFATNSFILPSGPSQSYSDIDRVIRHLNSYK